MKCSNFIDCFNVIKTVYKLFDNPSKKTDLDSLQAV